MVRQHHQLEGHEFEQTPGDGAGQGSLACCSPQGCKESRSQQLNDDKRPIKILFSNQVGVLTNRTLVIYVQIHHCLLLLIIAKSCPALCDPMDCSLPGFSVLGILQARILEWIATSYSRDLPNQGSYPHLLHWQVDSLPPGTHCWYINSKYPKPSCLSYPVYFLPQPPICVHSSLSHFFQKCWHPPSIQNTPHSCTSMSCLCDRLVIYVRCTCIHG